MSADVIVFPVARVEHGADVTPRQRRAPRRAERVGLMVAEAVGVSTMMGRVEIWFRSEEEAQELFNLICSQSQRDFAR